jgi:hypothetical protein
MDKYQDDSTIWMWLMALVLVGLVAGCGGSVSSLGTAGTTVSIPR